MWHLGTFWFLFSMIVGLTKKWVRSLVLRKLSVMLTDNHRACFLNPKPRLCFSSLGVCNLSLYFFFRKASEEHQATSRTKENGNIWALQSHRLHNHLCALLCSAPRLRSLRHCQRRQGLPNLQCNFNQFQSHFILLLFLLILKIFS